MSQERRSTMIYRSKMLCRSKVILAGRHHFLAALLASCVVVAAPNEGFQLFTDPGKRFSIEYPKDWRWTIVAGSGEAIVLFVHPRNEAAFVVEHFRMKQALAAEEVTDVFAQIESEVLKENQPQATNIEGQILRTNGQPRVLLNYTRPGLGENERVRQYSFPFGQDLFRLTCMAVTSQFKKYDATFSAVAESLRSTVVLQRSGATRP